MGRWWWQLRILNDSNSSPFFKITSQRRNTEDLLAGRVCKTESAQWWAKPREFVYFFWGFLLWVPLFLLPLLWLQVMKKLDFLLCLLRLNTLIHHPSSEIILPLCCFFGLWVFVCLILVWLEVIFFFRGILWLQIQSRVFMGFSCSFFLRRACCGVWCCVSMW